MKLDQRVAIITGGASGIGKAIARKVADDGMVSLILDLSDKGLEVSKEIEQSGGKSGFYKVDVGSEISVCDCINEIEASYQKIDILVNNAGIRPTKPFKDMSSQEWNTVIRINLFSVFSMCSAVLPIMTKNHWGRIVNISSLAAQQGSTGGHSHYAASKAGIVGLSKSLAREYARDGITLNVISPGLIDTPGWGDSLDGKREEYAQRIPIGRMGKPEDIANAVSFLISEESAYITGINLPVNGGVYIS